MYFLDLLWVRYNCAKFHHCRFCVTVFWAGGGLFAPPPPHSWATPKKPILNRVNKEKLYFLIREKYKHRHRRRHFAIYINLINMVDVFTNFQINFIFSIRNYCERKRMICFPRQMTNRKLLKGNWLLANTLPIYSFILTIFSQYLFLYFQIK